jgi:hypothetical protein
MDIQKGPCKMCGATNYALSYGGPDICPDCDAYGFCPRCKSLKAENERLRDETAKKALN